MRVLFGLEVPAKFLELSDDELVGRVRGDELPFEFRPGGAGERAVRRDGTHECEAVRLPRREIVRAEGRGHVHEPRSVIREHEVSRDDDRVTLVVRQWDDVQWARVLEPREVGAEEGATECCAFSEQLFRGLAAGRREDEGPSGIPRRGEFTVLKFRMHRDRHVAGQRPRRRGPDDQLAVAAVDQRERDEHGLVAHLFVSEREAHDSTTWCRTAGSTAARWWPRYSKSFWCSRCNSHHTDST